jgi:heptosyltransferase-3
MKPSNILIFHIGSLGDTLVSVPALWAIRRHFADARITMLSDVQRQKHYAQPRDVLEGSGLIDDWIDYSAEMSWKKWRSAPGLMRLYKDLRLRRFEALIYVIRDRKLLLRQRDLLFFRLAGIRQFYGHHELKHCASGKAGFPLPSVPHQSDQIMKRLSKSGIPEPSARQGNMDIKISDSERKAADAWRRNLPDDGGRQWVAIGPGSKMPAKKWPVERFEMVVSRLIETHDVWPVIFGGTEDRPTGLKLVETWGRGYVAAGELGIRQGIVALERCALFLGNDTGTMHMAGAAGIPCTAIFSARDYPGLWYPYGNHHTVLRKAVDCEGCMLEICTDEGMKCLLSIQVADVYRATSNMLNNRIG